MFVIELVSSKLYDLLSQLNPLSLANLGYIWTIYRAVDPTSVFYENKPTH